MTRLNQILHFGRRTPHPQEELFEGSSLIASSEANIKSSFADNNKEQTVYKATSKCLLVLINFDSYSKKDQHASVISEATVEEEGPG